MRVSAIRMIYGGNAGNLLPLTRPLSHFYSDLPPRRHFSSMLRINFSSVTDMRSANSLFREMMRVRPVPSVYLFGKLLDAVMKMNQHRDALLMFDEMRRSGIALNEYTMNIAINCYCILDRVDLGFAMFGSFFKHGYEPDAVTFTTLIKWLCFYDKKGKMDEAIELFRSMVDEGLKPNIITYSCLIDGYCKKGKVDEAKQLFRSMVDEGLEPDIVTYNSLMDGYCKKGKMDEAKELFRSLVDEGLKQNIVTYSCLIDGYCKEGKMDEAKELFRSMVDEGLKPNVVTYNCLIDGHFKNGKIDEAWKLYNRMEAEKIQPTLVTCDIIFNGLLKHHQVDKAVSFLRMMENRGVIRDMKLVKGLHADAQQGTGFFQEQRKM